MLGEAGIELEGEDVGDFGAWLRGASAGAGASKKVVNPLLPYTHLSSSRELQDRSVESHPHPLLCPSLLVPLVRVLYMAPMNSASNMQLFKLADHACVYQSTRHTLLSFLVALLRGVYTRQQSSDPMIRKMIDALPSTLLGTRDDVTGTNLSTFSTHNHNAANHDAQASGMPPLLSIRLLDLLNYIIARRNYGTARFFFSPMQPTAAIEHEPAAAAAAGAQQPASMQDLSNFSLDALASPSLQPMPHPTEVPPPSSKKDAKHGKGKGKQAPQHESPLLPALPPPALSLSVASPPPIIDLFALFGSSLVSSSRDHVRSLTLLLADLVSLPTQLLADLRSFRKTQAVKAKAEAERKAAAAAKAAEKKKGRMEDDEQAFRRPAGSRKPLIGGAVGAAPASSAPSKFASSRSSFLERARAARAAKAAAKAKAAGQEPAEESKQVDESKEEKQAEEKEAPAASAAAAAAAAAESDDAERIWSDPEYPFPLPACPILPAWCFRFLLSTIHLDGYVERGLECVLRILLYFGERAKNREIIIRELVQICLTLSASIQADLQLLATMTTPPPPPVPVTPSVGGAASESPLSPDSRKRKRADAAASVTQVLTPPVANMSSSTLMWSISQRESALLRFVRILNTLGLIEPPVVAAAASAASASPSPTATAASSAGSASDASGKGKAKNAEDESNLTSLIKLPAHASDMALLSPTNVAANKELLRDLSFTQQLSALWTAMDRYFDFCEHSATGFVVLTKPDTAATGAAGEEGDADEKKGDATPLKDDAASAAAAAAAEKAAELSKKLQDHRRDLTEEANDSATTRESDLLLLMHLPLIEAYFIFFAPRQQPKIHDSLSLNDANRAQLADKIKLLDEPEQAAAAGVTVEGILATIAPTAPVAPPPPSAASSELASFHAFTAKHRRPLNVALRQHKSLLQGSMRSLLWHPQHVLDFDIRRKHFKSELRRLQNRIKSSGAPGIKLYVRRDRIFEDSMAQLSRFMTKSNKDELLKNKLNIRFYGEEGLDAGGLAREWFLLLSRAIFNADNALFKPAANNPAVFQPNPESHINPDHLQFFRFAGVFVAKALLDNQRLDAYFTRSFYKHLLSLSPAYADVESVDADKFKSLDWMLHNSIDHVLYETFSTESNDFGELKTVDLFPGGRDVQVTDANKRLYVHLISEFILTRAIHAQLSAFLQGFYSLIPARLVSVFNEQEVELMICGLPDIDLADLRKHIEYRGFGATPNDAQEIQWWWQIVSEFTQQERALLLLFVTGTSKIPLEGFKALQGTNGITPFTLQKADGIDRLPLSHTCFNQLDLPHYCLASSSLVRLPDGGSTRVDKLCAGDQVVGSDGQPTAVLRAELGQASKLLRVNYATGGSHTVTPNHQLVLRWGRDPEATLAADGHSLSLAWMDADSLAWGSHMTWRFEHGQACGAVDEATLFHADKASAIVAAKTYGNRLCAAGQYHSGSVTNSVFRDAQGFRFVRLLLSKDGTSKPARAIHFKISAKHAGLSTLSHAPVLPAALVPHASAFASWWLKRAEAQGAVSVLREGDLFEVRAKDYADLSSAVKRHATLPLLISSDSNDAHDVLPSSPVVTTSVSEDDNSHAVEDEIPAAGDEEDAEHFMLLFSAEHNQLIQQFVAEAGLADVAVLPATEEQAIAGLPPASHLDASARDFVRVVPPCAPAPIDLSPVQREAILTLYTCPERPSVRDVADVLGLEQRKVLRVLQHAGVSRRPEIRRAREQAKVDMAQVASKQGAGFASVPVASVETVAGGEFVALEVAAPDGRFVLADGVVTHNSSVDVMREKLLLALREGSQGFGFR